MSVSRFVPAIVLIAAVLGGPIGALAQTPPPSVASPDAVTPPAARLHHWRGTSFLHALRAVDLTPAQQTQVDAFRAERTRADANADPATRQANARKMRSEIIAILTPAQKAQLHAQLHRARRYPMGAPAPSPNAATPAPN